MEKESAITGTTESCCRLRFTMLSLDRAQDGGTSLFYFA